MYIKRPNNMTNFHKNLSKRTVEFKYELKKSSLKINKGLIEGMLGALKIMANELPDTEECTTEIHRKVVENVRQILRTLEERLDVATLYTKFLKLSDDVSREMKMLHKNLTIVSAFAPMSLVAHRFGRVEFRIFVIVFFRQVHLKKSKQISKIGHVQINATKDL